MNFLEADVPDPTDFPEQSAAPGLRVLDGSFRCDICGDLFNAPVTISCGHCFCSACVRTALRAKQECPSCRKPANEAHIRPNPILESVVSAWNQSRPFILGLISRQDELRRTPSSAPSESPVKKRKRSADSSPSRERASSSSAGPSKHREVDLATPKPPPKAKKFKPRSSSPVVPSSDAEENEITITGTSRLQPTLKGKNMVSCPACNRQIPLNTLNAHLDKLCKDDTSKPKPASAAKDWSKLLSGGGGGGKNNQSTKKGKHKKNGSDSDDEYPLPIASYNTLKDKQLKDMLSEHDLPTTGDRSTLEQRHGQWVILFNSNLDKSVPNRRTKADLRRDLKKWEEDRSKKRKQPAVDAVSHQKTHNAEFKRLIEDARKSRPPKSKPSEMSSSQPGPPASSSQSAPAKETIVDDSEDERTGVLR